MMDISYHREFFDETSIQTAIKLVAIISSFRNYEATRQFKSFDWMPKLADYSDKLILMYYLDVFIRVNRFGGNHFRTSSGECELIS